ncbi:MAG: hypothetical protein ACJ780_19010 [Solirubrobacteraceae bacterium]
MTWSALTPGARGSTKKSGTDARSRPATARASGHRSGVRRQVTPRGLRRVSGPAGGAGPAPAGPVRAPARTRPSRRPRPPATVKVRWRARPAACVRALSDHALLDRIIRGRAWIPLFGLLLVGIVAMQVEVLKLNAGIGRSIERASALQSQNELLRAGVTRLSDEQRIERIAAQMGMVMPAPDQARFVTSGPVSVERALTRIKAPDASGFLAQLPIIGAPAAAQGSSTNVAVGIASSTPSTSTSTAASAATAATSSTGAPTAQTSPSSTGSAGAAAVGG